MKKSFVLIFVFLIFMSLVASILGSYESNFFTISGYVFDSAGNPLASVPIELENETMWIDDKTNSIGYFEFSNLAKGLYKLYINEEEEIIGCSARDEVSNCHALNDRTVCENSYANYSSTCGLPEGEYGFFPCFWGDVGEGKEACYYSCDQCAFGINQNISENYTSINFEDENIINLTNDLEINTTLLKIDAKLELNSSVFKNGDIIKANVTVKNNEAFNLINWGAVFGIWGWGDDEDEELYFNFTLTNLSAGKTRSYIFTYKIPENNTYNKLYSFGGIGTFDWDVESSQGPKKALTYKVDEKDICIGDSDCDGIKDDVDNCPYDYNPGQEDSDGNGVGDVCELSIAISGYVFDSAGNPLASVPIELENETMWIDDKTNSIGYFEFSNLANGFYELYINEKEINECSIRDNVSRCHDITNKAVCENSYAESCSEPGYSYCDLLEGECGYFPCFWGDVGEGGEACYFTCDECMFGVNQSISEDYTTINFEDENMINLTANLEINATLLRINASLKLDKYNFRNGDTIKANVTVKNNENFDLKDWLAAFGIEFYNETYDEEIYFNITPTNLSALQTKSFMFNFKIPENNSYDRLYVYGGLGKMDWKVMSNQGNLFSLTYKIDEKEIIQIIKLPGDVNGDCKVDIFDLAKVGLCYGCSSAQACWLNCEKADVKLDGIINIFDLATVGLNYGKSC